MHQYVASNQYGEAACVFQKVFKRMCVTEKEITIPILYWVLKKRINLIDALYKSNFKICQWYINRRKERIFPQTMEISRPKTEPAHFLKIKIKKTNKNKYRVSTLFISAPSFNITVNDRLSVQDLIKRPVFARKFPTSLILTGSCNGPGCL